jgi:hypothetical protein
MKKGFAFGLLSLAITAGTLVAGGFQPIAPEGGDDNIQPIPPMSDVGSTNLQPGPGVTAVAVPEPSTLSLLAGSAVLGSWFCLRRRRR